MSRINTNEQGRVTEVVWEEDGTEQAQRAKAVVLSAAVPSLRACFCCRIQPLPGRPGQRQ
ncbi:MAG: hypothetical protein R3F26_06970 [Gammaproteobacteria bacterium]